MPSGGNHGGGRPPLLAKQSKENARLAVRLKEVVNVTLDELTPRYRDLVRKGVDLALGGNQAMLKLFIELPFRSLDFSEAPESALDEVRKRLDNMLPELAHGTEP